MLTPNRLVGIISPFCRVCATRCCVLGDVRSHEIARAIVSFWFAWQIEVGIRNRVELSNGACMKSGASVFT